MIQAIIFIIADMKLDSLEEFGEEQWIEINNSTISLEHGH